MAVEARTTTQPAPSARPRPKREREEEVLVWPDLVFVEFISAVLFTITFLVLSVFMNAPLLNRANPELTPNPSKAPWYFLNLQELLLHMDKAWAGVLLPTIALVFFASIPYIDRSREGQGVWFGSKYAVRLTIVAAVYAVLVSALLVAVDSGDRSKTEYLTRWVPSCDANAEHQGLPCLQDEGENHVGFIGVADVSTRLKMSMPFPDMLGIEDGHMDWPEDLDHIPVPFNNICGNIGSFHLWCDMHINLPATMAQQVIPLSTIAVLAVAIIYVMFRVGWLRTRRDLFIVMFTAVMASYLTLSMVGSFFRGEGQALIWPWEIKVDEG
jgi:hypothetical protein